jgi:hypothetical protein
MSETPSTAVIEWGADVEDAQYVRARDKFQVNSTNDPEPFLYWQALDVIVNAILTVPEVLVAIAPAIVVWQALGLSPPTKLTSEAMSASQRVEAR